MRFAALGAGVFVVAAAACLALSRSGAAEEAPKPRYVGDKTCLKCHYGQHSAWKKTGMARALKTLAPTTEAENKARFDAKKAAGLDPAKDYTADAKCLKCHTTGFGEPGGYPAELKKDDAQAAKVAAAMGTVSCEACHGPGSAYVAYKEPIVVRCKEEGKEAKFTWEELSRFGLAKPDAAVCARCHNDQAPSKPAEPFDFERAKLKVHPKPVKPEEGVKPPPDSPKK